ncbi:hypothetical protein ACHAQF_006586 [Verticillium nonalfalfae]
MTRQTVPNLSRHTDLTGNSHGAGSAPASAPVRSGHVPYSVREAPFGAPKHLRIVTIGAGASGLNMIRTLRNTLPPSSFDNVVYEKNADIGGTWFENRYPGCKCDVPSHNYQFSWRKNPEWSSFFAAAGEIEAYLCKLCDDEGMRAAIKTSHKILGAAWSEPKAVWELQVQNLTTGDTFSDYANFLIDASGILNKWKWPSVPGVKDFKGTLVHTAAWPENFDFKDKTVAVIGNGASGVQVLPAILPHVKKLHHLIRSPTAILPPRIATMKMGRAAPIINQIGLDEQENFTPAQIERFKSDPAFLEQFTQALEMDSNIKFAIALMKDSPQQQWAAGKVREFMTAMLRGNEKLCQQLIPDFPLGCRRMTPAPGYLESFHDPKVSLVTTSIKRFVPQGIELETGELIEVDAIICATGFDSSFKPPFSLVGRHGNLQDIWTAETPKSYLSLAVAGLPNYFKFLGPYAPIAHGDVFTLSEHIATYIANLINKAQSENIRSLAPSQAAVDDFAAHVAAFMPRTAFSGSCRSWYKQDEAGAAAPVVGLHPGSRMHFISMLARFRGEDWEFAYENESSAAKANRFAYLGNGFTMQEAALLKAAAAAAAASAAASGN